MLNTILIIIFSSGVKNRAYFKLLHCVLKLTVRSCKQSNSQVHVPSIQDSINSSIIEISSINNLQEEQERKKRKSEIDNIPVQPYMVVVDENDGEDQEFFVFYGSYRLKFHSFEGALDTLIQIFHVFNLKYSDASYWVWSFIQHYFFEINSPGDKKSHSVINLMHYLKKNL